MDGIPDDEEAGLESDPNKKPKTDPAAAAIAAQIAANTRPGVIAGPFGAPPAVGAPNMPL